MRLLDGLVGPPIEPLTPKHPSQPSLLIDPQTPWAPPPPQELPSLAVGQAGNHPPSIQPAIDCPPRCPPPAHPPRTHAVRT